MRLILLSLSITLLLVGCKDGPTAATDAPATDVVAAGAQQVDVTVTEITVEDADKALQSGAVAVDANSSTTRQKNGIVPDAVILTSSYKYDLAQLPEDKSKDLIFYCSSTSCTASDNAAERASNHGYEHVHIMREGIKGWKEAGKPTTPFTDS
ncbi:MAG: rhodanese-like domain-containing protein [Polyangiales bacterium]